MTSCTVHMSRDRSTGAPEFPAACDASSLSRRIADSFGRVARAVLLAAVLPCLVAPLPPMSWKRRASGLSLQQGAWVSQARGRPKDSREERRTYPISHRGSPPALNSSSRFCSSTLDLADGDRLNSLHHRFSTTTVWFLTSGGRVQ